MKNFFSGLARVLKWVAVAAVLLELFSFLIIMASNYYIYGQFRDGDPVRYDPYALFVRREGPRPTVHNPAGGEKGVRQTIWLFGGSTMNGATLDDAKTIPSFLAEYLSQEEPRLPAYLINFGEPSFNSLMEAKYLQKELIERSRRPRVIVFYDGANDCAFFAQMRTPDAHYGYQRLRGLIEGYYRSFFGLLKPLHAAVYSSFTLELYDKIRQGVIPIEPDSPALKEMVDNAEKRYDYVNQTAHAFGAQFLLFWQPCWWVEQGEVPKAVRDREQVIVGRHMALRHNFEVTYKALEDRMKGKPYFVNFRDVLCSRQEPAYQSDGIHLEDAGRQLVAHNMALVLKGRLARVAQAGGGSR